MKIRFRRIRHEFTKQGSHPEDETSERLSEWWTRRRDHAGACPFSRIFDELLILQRAGSAALYHSADSLACGLSTIQLRADLGSISIEQSDKRLNEAGCHKPCLL